MLFSDLVHLTLTLIYDVTSLTHGWWGEIDRVLAQLKDRPTVTPRSSER